MRVNQAGQPGSSPVQKSDSRAVTAEGAEVRKAGPKTSLNTKTAAPASEGGDVKTEISSRAKDLAKAKAVATQAPDTREEKIAELKRRIEAGKYKVDHEAVASRMVDEHLSTGDL